MARRRRVVLVHGHTIDTAEVISGHDAEDFIEDVLQKGASVITKQKIFGTSIVVDDVYNSLLDICANKLTESKAKVIFITGSYVKTTLKDMLKSLLGDKCHASKDNENNEFGIPFTILSMPKNTDYLAVSYTHLRAHET